MTNIKTTIAFAVLTSGLSAQTTAPASAKDIHELPDFVVTGSLWESDLTRTTASVTAFDSERLAGDTQHFGDLINTIPNLSWSATSSRPRYIQIRGIGENSQFEGETPDSSVRFLLDDLDFTGLGTIGNLFDVQQVEVLRGPQAGAYGVNAAGGVIKIVTNEPTSEWRGQVEGTIGNDSLFAGGFALGGPLLEDDPERLTFRFSAYQLQQDGFRDNQFHGKDDTNERDELNTRLKLRWIANEDWQWDATLFYADADNGYDEWSLDNTRFDTFSDEPGRDEQESFATSLRGKWTGLDKVEVTTITSFTDTDYLNTFDGDWANPVDKPDTYVGSAITERERQRWSEEIRFDSTDQEDAFGFIDRWTAGVYFEDFEEDTAFDFIFEGFPDPFETTLETQTISFYGQGTHLLGDKTRLTLGLRAEYYELETDVDFRDIPESENNPDFDDWLFGGKLTLEHDLSDTQTVFASITKGYKAGGANIFPGLEPDVPTGYDTEDLWNYEIGLRAEWLEGSIVTQVTLFYLDREDAQLRSSAGQGIDFTYATANAGDAEHYGTEGEATWSINKNWAISAGLGLLETELDSTGDQLSSAPNYTYNARIDYVAENGFFANFEVTGSDEFFESNNPDNRDQRTRSEFIVYNAAIGYSYENWTLTLWGRNLFDEEYEKRVFFFGNEGPDYTAARYENPADPQQFGVTLNYEW
jgi:outer membrane receptor protein involved in Fe transport